MAEYIIVGGGIYGCAVAWELARRGADVRLLEARKIASGASGGLGERGVRANGRDLRELPLMRLAYDIWPTLNDEIGASAGYRRLGHLHLIEREEDLAAAPVQVWMQNKQGIISELLDAAALREREPGLSEDVIAAIYCPKDGVADHTATTRAMAQAARHQGALIQEDAPVTGLRIRDGRVISVEATVNGEKEIIPLGTGLNLAIECACRRLRRRQLGLATAGLAHAAAGHGIGSAPSSADDSPHRACASDTGD